MLARLNRALFPHAERMVYLDHAATGPLSTPVVDAVMAFLRERSETNPNNYFDVVPTLERGRARLARLMGTTPDRVDYAPNTSAAINVLAQGLDWRPGDRVAVPACEFPANVQPWRGLASRGVAVDFIPAPRGVFALDDVEKTLTPRTRVLAVSWVQFLSGFRCDLRALADLAHARGGVLCVDAIQGLGALRLDVEAAGVDFLAGGGQKWLLGMQGSAFFYLTGALQARLTPVRGWLNGPVDWDDFGAFSDALHPDATRFRMGTLATAPLLGLDAALGVLLDWGPAATEARVLANAHRLAEGLRNLGLRRFGPPEVLSGIVTVEADAPQALHQRLEAGGIRCSLRDRKLRLSPHAYTSDADVDAALDAVERGLRTAEPEREAAARTARA